LEINIFNIYIELIIIIQDLLVNSIILLIVGRRVRLAPLFIHTTSLGLLLLRSLVADNVDIRLEKLVILIDCSLEDLDKVHEIWCDVLGLLINDLERKNSVRNEEV